MLISADFLSHAMTSIIFLIILFFSIHANHAKFLKKKVLRSFTCILDHIWKYHAFTWFRVRSMSQFCPCELHGDYVKWKMLGNNETFFFGDGGSRSILHGIFSWMIFQPRCYYHETYSFYHDLFTMQILGFRASDVRFFRFFWPCNA